MTYDTQRPANQHVPRPNDCLDKMLVSRTIVGANPKPSNTTVFRFARSAVALFLFAGASAYGQGFFYRFRWSSLPSVDAPVPGVQY